MLDTGGNLSLPQRFKMLLQCQSSDMVRLHVFVAILVVRVTIAAIILNGSRVCIKYISVIISMFWRVLGYNSFRICGRYLL